MPRDLERVRSKMIADVADMLEGEANVRDVVVTDAGRREEAFDVEAVFVGTGREARIGVVVLVPVIAYPNKEKTECLSMLLASDEVPIACRRLSDVRAALGWAALACA